MNEEDISDFAMIISNNLLVTKLDHNYELLFFLRCVVDIRGNRSCEETAREAEHNRDERGFGSLCSLR